MSNSSTYIIKPLIVLLLFLFVANSVQSQERRKSRDREEEINPNDFGQKASVGVSVLGIGLVGVTSKIVVGNGSQFEVDISYAPLVAGEELLDLTVWNKGVTFTGGLNFLLGKKDKWWNRKVIKHYISAKGGYWLSDYQNYYFAGPTWRRESYRYNNKYRSFGFDLGLVYLLATEERRFIDNSLVTVFFRMDLNFFKK